MRRITLGASLIAALSWGCRPALPDDEVPALRVDPTPAGQAELVAAIAAELHGAPVSIAPDVLTRTSLLVLERRTPPGPEGRAATGRTLEAPERFRLMTDGRTCYLVREDQAEPRGPRIDLPRTTCVPE